MSDKEKQLIDSRELDGVTYKIYRYSDRRPVVRMIPLGTEAGAASTPPSIGFHPYVESVEIHQVCVEIKNSSVILEPGALQFYKGNIQVEVMKHEPGKSWLSRKIASAGTGESPYGVKYSGTGEIWMEPASKHFIIVEVDHEMPMLLDDKAFYSCSGKIAVSTKRHNTLGGVLSGNDLVQPMLSGTGLAVVESPVSESELVFVELDGSEELVVDGDYMLFYSDTLKVTVGPLVSGLLNLKRSGEGLVFRMKGVGQACLMPTSKVS